MAPSRIKSIAKAAIADPRTVRRVINGESVRGMVAERIEDELRRRGMR
ncbi:MAG TPA: hypothetical protein VN544_07410 [Gaiellaceae bacterium]|nr:hypothetical protein [Gaiellaceae bacterium]